MNIMQCSLCKKPFQSYGGKICGECLVKLDEDFIKVRDYLDDHKNAGFEKITEDTGVPKQSILHLLKDGRLIIEDPEATGILLCEVCKKPISTGRMCKDCKNSVANTMQKNIDIRKPQAVPQNDSPSFKGAAKVNNR